MKVSRLLMILGIVAAAGCGSSTPVNPPPPPPPPGGHVTTITIVNNSFSPTPDTISAGNITFHWNSGIVIHNVTWLTGPSSPAGSGDGSQGTADYVTALVAGDYTYHCTHHVGMNGAIHVNP